MPLFFTLLTATWSLPWDHLPWFPHYLLASISYFGSIQHPERELLNLTSLYIVKDQEGLFKSIEILYSQSSNIHDNLLLSVAHLTLIRLTHWLLWSYVTQLLPLLTLACLLVQLPVLLFLQSSYGSLHSFTFCSNVNLFNLYNLPVLAPSSVLSTWIFLILAGSKQYYLLMIKLIICSYFCHICYITLECSGLQALSICCLLCPLTTVHTHSRCSLVPTNEPY